MSDLFEPTEGPWLSPSEAAELAEREAIIERGRRTFMEVAAALMDIRDRRLYRATHTNFEDYCRERWQFSGRHIHRMIAAVAIIEDLRPRGQSLPENEAQVRALSLLPAKQRQEAWEQAVASAPEGKVTGPHVRTVVERFRSVLAATTPERYIGLCTKGCYEPAEMRRGSVEEFGVEGIYVCSGCQYAYHPDFPPEEWDEVEHSWNEQAFGYDRQQLKEELRYQNEGDADESLFRLVPPRQRQASAYITLEQWKELTPEQQHEALSLPPSDRQFNRQDSRSIEWAQWSWNPVTGCKHDCPYCYARDIANRFYEQKFEPSLIPGRLRAPWNTPVPPQAERDIAFKNVFVCSMADLFGRWVPAEWIEAVLGVVRENPRWNFLFLTKFPKRYCEFEFPQNAWLGTTVDGQARVKNAEDAFAKVTGGTKWLSVEPLLEPLKFKRLDLFDWVVVGGASASSQTPEWVPPIDWIVGLHAQAREAGCRIYYKDNCGMLDSLRIREFPWSEPVLKELPESFRYLTGM